MSSPRSRGEGIEEEDEMSRTVTAGELAMLAVEGTKLRRSSKVTLTLSKIECLGLMLRCLALECVAFATAEE